MLLFFTVSPVRANFEQYVAVRLGVTESSKFNRAYYDPAAFSVINPTFLGNTSIFSLDIGATLSGKWRFGLECDYSEGCIRGVNGNSRHLIGVFDDRHHVWITSFMLNSSRMFYKKGRCSLWFGLGLGVTRFRYAGRESALGSGYSNHCHLLTGQVIVYADYQLNDRWSLTGGWRFKKTESGQLPPDPRVDLAWLRSRHIHCFEIGLRYTF